ncbi:hypothetical protein DFP72DRAFT_1084224 [Ephemerocybe angulata]|uniref:Uncharacterized protein n=1 Tax=Ephemerocybe angulata TaxID=980116 RepID=A0A8H6H6I0_9AGAR|nr:hypothetical protein DFP72DRAFT_1084224 [Tulosesus angulatus]
MSLVQVERWPISVCTSTPTPFDLSRVRTLTESEINSQWQALGEAWVLAVDKLQPKVTAEHVEQLTGIWQALFLCQAHLTQGQNHLIASTPFAAQLASLLTRLLTPTAPSEVPVTPFGWDYRTEDRPGDAAVREMWCGACYDARVLGGNEPTTPRNPVPALDLHNPRCTNAPAHGTDSDLDLPPGD